MRKESVLEHLEELARRIDIEIRQENLGTVSGVLCRIHDGRVILLNKHLSVASKIELLANELSLEREKLENLYILPEIRDLLDLD